MTSKSMEPKIESQAYASHPTNLSSSMLMKLESVTKSSHTYRLILHKQFNTVSSRTTKKIRSLKSCHLNSNHRLFKLLHQTQVLFTLVQLFYILELQFYFILLYMFYFFAEMCCFSSVCDYCSCL